jgi:hypothetical protein
LDGVANGQAGAGRENEAMKEKPTKVVRDMSPDAIRARYRACWEKPKPVAPAKVVLPLEVSAATAKAAKANPKDIKVATRDADGVSRIERVMVFEATDAEVMRKPPHGYVRGADEYYTRRQMAEAYRPKVGSVTHSYDPFAAKE